MALMSFVWLININTGFSNHIVLCLSSVVLFTHSELTQYVNILINYIVVLLITSDDIDYNLLSSMSTLYP
jgi:hypothetical protein